MNRRPPDFAPIRRLRVIEASSQRVRLASRRLNLEVRALAPDLFRLLILPASRRPEPSWAVIRETWEPVDATAHRSGGRVRLATAKASWEMDLGSGAWRVVDDHGLEVFSVQAGATGFTGRETRLSLDLAPREALFALGATTGTFNKRGLVREFWNIDVLGHAPAFHPGLRRMHASIPFAVTLRDGRAAGLFLDSPARQVWDLGQTKLDRWQIAVDSPGLDLYLFTGPRVPEILARYTELTGRMPLPPRWALGYHQCRYSYTSRAELERVAGEFRRRRIPCDAVYCDIDHMDGYRVFTFGKRFPNPAAMMTRLARKGFKVVAIVDPGVKDEAGFGVLRRGRKLDAFVKEPGGRGDFKGTAWPKRVVFPDFFSERVRAWWGEEQKALLDLGVAGIWNDMNEPANFARPDKTLDPRCVHRTDHGQRRHAQVHNAYGLQMARASQAGIWRHQPAARPFVISRAAYAGIQRHALMWTGDNSSCWEHLADAVQMLLNLGLSGVAFAGADVGGFLDNPTPELFLRWLQMAVFTPFLRNHSNTGTIAQEPWAFGPEAEAIARGTLELRYQLLPYLYGLFAEASRTGAPIMRPLLWHYPGDPVAVGCGDQFLLGDRMLVAPILRQGAVARSVYLPRGEWFDFWTGQRYPGGVHATVAAPLERIPVFVRAGTILPMTGTRQFVGRTEPGTVFLHLWPDDEGRLSWYDDDGATRACEAGEWQRREVVAHSTRRGGWLKIGAREGRHEGHTKTWRVVVRDCLRLHRVRIDGKPVVAESVPELGLLAFDVPAVAGATEARWR